MCFFVTITVANPDYKRPYADVRTKLCKTLQDVEDYKQRWSADYVYDHFEHEIDKYASEEEFLKEKIAYIWSDDYTMDEFEFYMDMDPLSFTVTPCLCCTKG